MKKILLFILLFQCIKTTSQTITLNYTKNLSKDVVISYQLDDNTIDNIIMNEKNSKLSINCNNYKVFTNCDINVSKIYAESNENINFYIDNKGLVGYSCQENPIREKESKYINESNAKFGYPLTSMEKKILLTLNKKDNLKFILTESYQDEIVFLEDNYSKQLISKNFYIYFKNLYWCLSMINKLEDNKITLDLKNSIQNSFNDFEYLTSISEYIIMLNLYNKKLLGKNEGLLISNEIENQNAINLITFTTMKNHINSALKINDEMYTIFKEKCKNPAYLHEIEYALNFNSKSVTEIIESNKGKILILDFWATWCMPCRAEFNYQKLLIKKYPTVKFLFISVDENKATWIKISKKYDSFLSPDNNYVLKDKLKDQFIKKINLTSIPRYVLIDKFGAIININLPNPSSGKLEKLIENSLKQ